MDPLVNVYITNYGKSQFLMGKSTISMAIFNSYVCLPDGTGNGMNNGYDGSFVFPGLPAGFGLM